MNDEHIKKAVAVFMSRVNHTAQREFEKVVRHAIASGKLKSSEALSAAVTLSSKKIGLDVTIHGQIKL